MMVQPDGRWRIFAGGSKWTIKPIDEALVPETTSDDYARYKAIVNELRGSPMNGQVGQLKSTQVVDNAIDSLTKWSNIIDHSSYNSFLAKWDALYKGLFWKERDIEGIRQAD